MAPSLEKHIAEFKTNRSAVFDLLGFDEAVIQIVISQLTRVEERNRRAWEAALKGKGMFPAEESFELQPRLSLTKAIQGLEQIRDHGSLRLRYDVMTNQCVVLLVAHFGSAVRAMFRTSASHAVRERTSEPILRYEIKARAGELSGLDEPIHEFVADQLTSEISFQDMKSIARALKQYFGAELPRDSIVNNVIVAHAARHVIVHSGDTADPRFVHQIRDATPRTLLPGIKAGEQIQFSQEDVRTTGSAMLEYLQRVSTGLETAFPDPHSAA